MSDWNSVIKFLSEMVREHDDAPAYAMTIKLSEEVGEFSEIMLKEFGFLKHKTKEWKDTPAEEAADIINVLIATLVAHYPDKTPDEISNELLTAMIKKGDKYAKLIGAGDSLNDIGTDK